MSKGLSLHLRCFLEGVEVPIVSCSVSAAVGGPASAHIELLDSEKGFELLPRTMIHVFFYDDEDGHAAGSPDMEAADRNTNVRESSHYKLLFCGETFSIYHSKSGYGSRSLTIMALDISNVLDTSYIFQVSYSDTDGVLGTGTAAESQFVSAASITGNPFDNIINSPQEVIKNISKKQASSAIHAVRSSKLGGLFSIFELLLGVEGYAIGMNLWTSIQERRIRLLDSMAADSGVTAQKLFDDTVFNEWLTNSVSNTAPSMSYRGLADLIMGYIYYGMVSIPTASYFKPKGSSGREPYTVVPPTISVPAAYRDYFFDDKEFSEASFMDPAFLANVVKVIDKLRAQGYTTTKITSGFRTAEEADALYGKSKFVSPHSKGIAADIDWNDIPNGELFRLGNVALSKGRSVGDQAVLDSLIAQGYIAEGATSITDVKIIRFFLDYKKDEDWWKASAVILQNILFGGSIENTYQFLHYMLVYPLMPDCSIPADGRSYWTGSRDTSLEAYIKLWRDLWKGGKLVGTHLLGYDSPHSMIKGMQTTNPAYVWLSGWLTTYKTKITSLMGTVPTIVSISNGNNAQDVQLTAPWAGGLLDVAVIPDATGCINSVIGLFSKEHREVFNRLWYDYYTAKSTFWDDKARAVKEVSAVSKPAMFSGAGRLILSGSPEFSPQMFFIFADKDLTATTGVGDDPVHIQSADSFDPPKTDADPIARERALAIYNSRERLTGFLIRPDIWMCAPPVCNVIFPDDIISLNISRELMRQTTRTFLMTYDQLYADNVIFNGHYFAPQFTDDLPSIQKKAFGVSTSNEVVYPHEVFTGIIPKVNKMSEVAFYSKATTVNDAEKQILSAADFTAAEQYTDPDAKLSAIASKGTATAYDYVKAYASDVAHFNLMKQRYSANRVTVNARFLPMVVPGLPAVVIGQTRTRHGFSSTHTWLGMIESVQHSYNQGGATSAISLGTCRPYKTGDESIDELLKLKKAGKNLFKTQDPSFAPKLSLTDSSINTNLMFASAPSILGGNTTFEKLINGARKANVSSFAFPGRDWLINPNILVRWVTKICSNKQEYATRFAPTQQISAYVNVVDLTYTKGTDEYYILGDVDINYNTSGEVSVSPYGLLPLSTDPTKILDIKLFTGEFFAVNQSNYAKSTPAHAVFDGIDFFSTGRDKKAIADLTAAQAVLVAEAYTKITTATDILVEKGDGFVQVAEVISTPQPEPTLAYLVVTFALSEQVFVVDTAVITDINAIPISIATPDQMMTQITVDLYGNATATFPVLLPTSGFRFKTKEASATANTGNSNNLSAAKYRPLEEAIMPAWLDDQYKNGNITASTSTIEKNSATIDKATGIGFLYRDWFGCDSIVDNVTYKAKSEYATVTIEEAVDNIISRYSNSDIGSTYKYTKRNIATLTDMLGPITDKEITSDIPKTGGFHSRAIGDFENLERLGITGKALKGGAATEKTVTISTLSKEDLEKGLSLDPRKARLARVKAYKNDVTRNRGKQG